MKSSFTIIKHDFRKGKGLSCLEYVLLDMVYCLMNNQRSAKPGWCYMSREVMANELGLSKQGLLNMLDRLIERGFLIKNEVDKNLKVTTEFSDVYFTDGKQSLPQDSQLCLLDGGKESLPNKNSSYNNNLFIGGQAPLKNSSEEKLKQQKKDFWELFSAFVQKNTKENGEGVYPKALLVKFAGWYLQETSKSEIKYMKEKKKSGFSIGLRFKYFLDGAIEKGLLNGMWAIEKTTPSINEQLKDLLQSFL